jgi:D-lyxose ketol-isomerase
MASLKRSTINQSIELAMKEFRRHSLFLPPFAFWSPEEWSRKGDEVNEIRECRLGWDVTDFGLGKFDYLGRILFTLRNGWGKTTYPKAYAEKFILDPPGQRAPWHLHWRKREDIINRGIEGTIVVQVCPSNPDGSDSDQPFTIQVNGITNEFPGGRKKIRLDPGDSLCLEPGILHQFWGAEGDGVAVSGEVSSVCDDVNDNLFVGEESIRFPAINEDEEPRYLLCNEYRASRVR